MVKNENYIYLVIFFHVNEPSQSILYSIQVQCTCCGSINLIRWQSDKKKSQMLSNLPNYSNWFYQDVMFLGWNEKYKKIKKILIKSVL